MLNKIIEILISMLLLIPVFSVLNITRFHICICGDVLCTALLSYSLLQNYPVIIFQCLIPNTGLRHFFQKNIIIRCEIFRRKTVYKGEE